MILALRSFFGSKAGVYLLLAVVLSCLWYIASHFDLIEAADDVTDK